MSRISDLIAKRGLVGRFLGSNVLLEAPHRGVKFKTGYALGDFPDGLDTERLVYCLLGELGAAATQPTVPVNGWPLEAYVAQMRAILGGLDEWLEAMDADLGLGDIEQLRKLQSLSKDPLSEEFALMGLPSTVIFSMIFGEANLPE